MWVIKYLLYPRVPLIYKTLNRLQVSGARILDIGAGDGQYVLPFKGTAIKELQLVDLSPSNADFLKKLFPEAQIYSEEALGFLERQTSENVDYIRCLSTLHYIDNYRQVLQEMHRILTSKGKLLLYVPVHEHREFFLYSWIFNRFSNYESTMNRKEIFTYEGLMLVFRDLGFKTLEFQASYGWFGRYSHELLSIGTILLSQRKWIFKILGMIWLFHLIPVILILNFLELQIPPKGQERFNGGIWVLQK